MEKVDIVSPTQGLAGFLHEVEYDKTSILVFQLPRPTNMLSNSYVENALKVLNDMMPDHRRAIVIGSDVNIYELAGPEAVALKLKGLI
jgi:hypothetical protein